MKKLFIFITLILASFVFVACTETTTEATTTVTQTTTASTTTATTTEATTTQTTTTEATTTEATTTEATTTTEQTTTTEATTTTETTTTAPDVTPPIFLGIDDRVLFFGETFDPMAGVMALDDTDGSLTSAIQIEGEVDLETEGTYVLTYSVTDSAGNEASVERTIIVYASRWIVPNSEFSDNVANAAENRNDPVDWGWHGNTGSMTAEISDGMAKIQILNAGTVPYGTQFYLLNRTIEQGKNYRITFMVKADAPRPLEVVLENGIGGTRMFDYTFDMTTEWQEITFDHYQFAPTIDGNGKFAFFAGNINSSTVLTTYYLDYVRVEEIPVPTDTEAPELIGVGPVEVLIGTAFDPLAGVSFIEDYDFTLTLDDLEVTGADLVDINTIGEYTVTYTLTDASGNVATVNRTVKIVNEIMTSSFMVVNGDFSYDQVVPYPQPAMNGWGWHGSGSFLTYIKDGLAHIDVYDTWYRFYGTQFYQQNRVLTEGQVYQITFMAKANEPRLLQIQLEASGFSTVAAVFELTTEWQEFTFEYEHLGNTISNVKFGFFAGNIHGSSSPTTVFLDDIDINVISEKSADTTAPQIWGVEDYYIVQDNVFDPLIGLKVYDLYDKGLTLDDVVVVSNDVDTSTVGTYTVEYSLTDVSGNVATYTREVYVIAQGDAADTRITFIDGDFELQNPITDQDSNQGWTLKGNGGYNAAEFVDDRSGKVAKITVTDVGTIPHSVQFHQMLQPGFVSEFGAMYKFTFWAKADDARDIAVQLQENSGWLVLTNKTVSITTDWVQYEVILVNQVMSYEKVKIGFFFGLIDSANPTNSVATSVYIDDVNIELIGYVKDEVAPRIYAPDASVEQNAAFDPMSGIKVGDSTKLPNVAISSDTVGLVTLNAETGLYSVDTSVAGTYTLTYTVTDMYGNETVYDRTLVITDGTEESSLQVVNGDFSTDQTTPYAQPAVDGWGWHGSGVFFTSIEDGMATIDVYNTWYRFYGTQFYEQNRTLVQGETYLFSFMAKADEARLLQMNLEASGMTTVTAIFELGTEWQLYTFEYTHTGSTTSAVKFAFFAGNIFGTSAPTKVYLDDITVERIFGLSADTENPQIWGVEDYYIVLGNAFDPLLGLKPWDNQDRSLTVDNIVVVSNNVDTSTVGIYTVEYSVTDASRNTATYTRTVYVIEEANAAETRITFIDGDFELQNPVTDSDNNQGWTLKGNGGFNPLEFVDDRGGKVAKITVTDVGTIPHSVQFHQMNQPGFISEFGAMYKFTFWAKADDARDIAVQLQENSGWLVLFNKTISITTDWVQYEVIMVNQVMSYEKVKIGFFFGLIDSANPSNSVATSVYIDDVSIELIGYVKDDVAPRIFVEDATILANDAFNPMTGVVVGDFTKLPEVAISSDTVGLVTFDAETGVYTVDTSVAGTYTLTYTVTDMYGNETIYNRTLTIN